MSGLNKVILLGNLTRDPELRRIGSGTAVCALGLATNRRFTTASGESREETCFVDIDVWGAQAESCAGYLRKGAQALVEGRLRLDQWQDRETGKNRSRLKVTAERVQFMNLPRGADFGDPAAVNADTGADNRGDRPQADAQSGSGMPTFDPIPMDDAGDMDTIPF